MNISEIIENKGYDPKTGRRVSVLFPKIQNSQGEVIQQDQFDETFAMWLAQMYPIMISEYGEESIDSILTNYTYVLRNEYLTSKSGYCKHNEIVGNWYFKNLKEALTIFLHETGHAIGGPYSTEKLLCVGYDELESFFTKLEEAIVSERQNIIEYGEFSASYQMETYSSECSRRNNVKSRSDKYSFYQVYLELLKLLLGKEQDLIYQNAQSGSIEEHDTIYIKAKEYLKSILTKEQFDVLANSLNGVIIHLNYPDKKGTIDSKRTLIVDRYRRKSAEAFDEEYRENVEFAKEHGKYEQSIEDDIDDLCALVMEVLKTRLKDNSYEKFEALKQISRYFVMVRNISPKLERQTTELLELYNQHLSTIKFSENVTKNFDTTILLHYILSIPEITLDKLNNARFMKGQDSEYYIILGENQIFSVKQEPNFPEKVGVPYADPYMKGIIFERANSKTYPNRNTTRRIR